MNFEEFGLAQPIVRAVSQEGYSVATPIQAQAIPVVLEGHDVIGIAQTGTGKTAAFALPILHRLTADKPQRSADDRRASDDRSAKPRAAAGTRKIKVLILASTRELAVQIHESFTNYGAFAAVKVAVIYGGVGQQPQVNALRNGVDVVVATPGRLLDLMQQGHVRFDALQVLVLDEADRMLDMGFFPAIRRILEKVPKQRQTLMFSATMKPEIRDLANSILHNPVSISIVPKQKTTELVEQSVCFVPQKQKTRLLIELINRNRPTRAIVFSRTKHGADRIVRHLEGAGLRAEAIHANKSQNKRQRTLDDFKSENPPILVATDIAARGIDVDNVSHVFIHDMPTEEETYVHRIGRSGRAGATGVSISLCDPDERRMLRSIEKLIGMSITVQEVDGFDFKPTAEESGTAERTHRDPRHPSNRRGAVARPQRPASTSSSRGSRSTQSTQGSRGVRGDRSQSSQPSTSSRTPTDRGSRPRAGEGRAPTERSSSGEQRARQPQRPARTRSSDSGIVRPATRRETSDSFGDGVHLEGASESHASSAQAPRRRRRRRPSQANS